MHISFAEKDETFLKSLVEAGYYTNVSEAIRDAVRRMREADQEKGEYHNAMYTAVLKGEEQYAKGQYQEYTPELHQQIQRNAHLKVQQGVKPKADVIPHEV